MNNGYQTQDLQKKYIDSNNCLHNLDGPSSIWIRTKKEEYYIHGKYFKNKQDWELEVNRIKMIDEL